MSEKDLDNCLKKVEQLNKISELFKKIPLKESNYHHVRTMMR